jgi:hypothetical protein
MEDFKSAASAIPPPRHVVLKPNHTKSLLFAVSSDRLPSMVRSGKGAGLVYPVFRPNFD